MSAPHESDPRRHNDARVLDANLKALLLRAYRPAQPSAAFRSRLTQLVAASAVRLAGESPALTARAYTARGDEVRSLRLRRSALAAAAVLLATGAAFLAWTLARDTDDLRAILERGAVAVRADARGAWSERSAAEARAGLSFGTEFLEVATPDAASALVLAAEGRLDLSPEAQARLARASASGFDLELVRGRALWHGPFGERELVAPLRWHIEARSGAERAAVVRAEPQPADATPAAESPTAPARRSSGVLLRGRVIDAASAEPVPDFSVAYQKLESNDDIDAPRKTFAKAVDGRFEIDPPAASRLAVRVMAEGFAVRSVELVWPPADPAGELVFELEQGGIARGLVVDAATGEPIANAIVFSEIDVPERDISADEAYLPVDLRRTRTDERGQFELGPLSTGRQILRAMHAERAAGWSTTFDLAPGLPHECGTIALGPGGSIDGLVLRPNGQPWGATFVIAFYFDFNGEHGCSLYTYAPSDGSGAFAIERLPAGNYLLMHFGGIPSGENAKPIDLIQVRVDVGAVTRVQLGAPAGEDALRGVLLDEQGAPAPQWTLTFVQGDDLMREGWPMAFCGEDGRFALPQAPAATYFVYATRNEGRTLVYCGTLEFLPSEKKSHELRLGSGAFAGAVSRSDSMAIADATVLLERRTSDRSAIFAGKASTDLKGRYVIEGLQPGEYRAIAYDVKSGLGQESSGWTHLLRDERRSLDFKLWPGGELEIEVVDEQGAPIVGATVNLKNPEGSAIPFAPLQQTDPRGRFLARGCAPGTWRATAEKAGHELVEPRQVDVRIGERGHVRLVLTPR